MCVWRVGCVWCMWCVMSCAGVCMSASSDWPQHEHTRRQQVCAGRVRKVRCMGAPTQRTFCSEAIKHQGTGRAGPGMPPGVWIATPHTATAVAMLRCTPTNHARTHTDQRAHDNATPPQLTCVTSRAPALRLSSFLRLSTLAIARRGQGPFSFCMTTLTLRPKNCTRLIWWRGSPGGREG